MNGGWGMEGGRWGYIDYKSCHVRGRVEGGGDAR